MDFHYFIFLQEIDPGLETEYEVPEEICYCNGSKDRLVYILCTNYDGNRMQCKNLLEKSRMQSCTVYKARCGSLLANTQYLTEVVLTLTLTPGLSCCSQEFLT